MENSTAEITDAAINEIQEHLLLRPGPLTTPRAVYKTIRYSMRTKAQEKLTDIMAKLERNGLGAYVQLSSNESVFFKPLPNDDNKEKIEPLLTRNKWTDYCNMFTSKEATRLISEAQFNRLIKKSPFLNNE